MEIQKLFRASIAVWVNCMSTPGRTGVIWTSSRLNFCRPQTSIEFTTEIPMSLSPKTSVSPKSLRTFSKHSARISISLSSPRKWGTSKSMISRSSLEKGGTSNRIHQTHRSLSLPTSLIGSVSRQETSLNILTLNRSYFTISLETGLKITSKIMLERKLVLTSIYPRIIMPTENLQLSSMNNIALSSHIRALNIPHLAFSLFITTSSIQEDHPLVDRYQICTSRTVKLH